MDTIGYQGLLRLLRDADGIQGYFIDKATHKYGPRPYQLILLQRIPLKTKKITVGECREWHVVTFLDEDGALGATPATYLQADYGTADALRILIAHEIRRARSASERPKIDAYPANWGYHDDDRPATFHVAGNESIGASTNRAYTFVAGQAQLTLGGFEFQPTGKYGASRWAAPSAKDNTDLEHRSFYYVFAATADTKSNVRSAKAS